MLFGMTSPLPLPIGPLTPRLEVVPVDDQRNVFLNGHLVARYPCDDKGTERVLVSQLAEVLPLPDRQIAAAFGLHAVTLSRFRSQARRGGAAALMPRKTGPQKPHKMTPRLEARCRALRAQGLSLRAIAERVSRPGRTISHVSVATLFQGPPTPPQPALPLETATPPEPDDPSTLAAARPGESRFTRYAGALLLYAALGRLDLWGVFQGLGAATGPARQFGWRQTVAAIVFCFALRFRSLEDWKNGRRQDLGVLIGQPHAPSVLSLRSKVKALAESVDPLSFSREMFRRYLALEPVWEGLYYVDGHFCPYYGQHPTPRGWDAKRRLAVKGHTDVYLHDARGRVLFFFSQPLNDSLARALPAAVEEIRRVHGPQPFILVFDRGGYSGDAFRFLQQQNIGFITYLRGRSARRRYARKKFRPGWFLFENHRHTYQRFEKKTRLRRVGSLRTILVLGEEGQQIPVLTNLAPAGRAAQVVHCLRLRWRQENSFKFLSEHYAIDQIVQYGADPETQDRLVPNPKRKALQQQVRACLQRIQALQAQLGGALDHNQESRRATVRGLKIAHARLRREIAQQRQVLARLENRLRHTPGRISAAQVDRTRALLREDRRLIVNALKIAAGNAERMLALRFDQSYQRPQDVRSVFRALLQLPGQVTTAAPDRLEVRLHRPDSEKVARALEHLLADLNREPPRLLGNGPILTFGLSDVNKNPLPTDRLS
jgi:transposase